MIVQVQFKPDILNVSVDFRDRIYMLVTNVFSH